MSIALHISLLVAVAKNHIQIATFFNLVAKVFNIVGASCKRRDILREKRNAKVIEALKIMKFQLVVA